MTDVTPAPGDRLQIDVRADADPLTFVLDGELDPHTSPMLQERIDAELPEGATAVVLDFDAVGFVDSAGLRVIADTHRRLSEAGGGLTVRRPSSGLKKLLSVTGLSDHVSIEE
jgi:anti-anti-sigma factor